MNFITRLWRKLRQEDELTMAWRDQQALAAEKGELQDRVRQLEGQVQSVMSAAQQAAEACMVAMPSLEDGEWGLNKLVNTVINELDDARKTLDGVGDALAWDGKESLVGRAKQVACLGAVACAAGDVLGVPAGFVPEKIILDCAVISKAKQEWTGVTEQLHRAMKWLGARPKESLEEAVKRVILTLEVQPGAASELHKIRLAMDIPPGASVLETVKEPVSIKARVTKRKGEVVGVSVYSVGEWPKFKDVEVEHKEIQ